MIRPRFHRLLPALLAVAASALPAGAVEFSPVLNAELSGGYSRFSGDRLDGPNGSVLFVPGMRFGESFSLLPIFSADYEKARDVQELAGGGFLTVAQHSRGMSLRGVQGVGPLKLKAYGAYKQNFLKDTTDEAWGDGLFDYNKTAGGLEVEGKGVAPLEAWRAGLDYYVTKFPNFQSLASIKAGAEINTGQNVLDFTALDLPLSADLVFDRQRVEARLLTSLRRFPEQNIVRDDSTFSGQRRDLYWSLSTGLTRVLNPVSIGGSLESAAGLDLAYTRLDSNQNSLDAVSAAFRPNFYSYAEESVGPRWQFRWRHWAQGSLSYQMTFRSYADRPAQDASGADKGAVIRTRTQTFRWSVAVPIMEGISVRLQAAAQHADSNMTNETTYRYNYTSSTYLFGFTYEL